MKKGLFTLLAGVCSWGAFAQQSIPTPAAAQEPKMNVGYTKRSLPASAANAGGQMSQWFSYAQLQEDLNSFTDNAVILFPDSDAIICFMNNGAPSSQLNTWFASGQLFDPKDVDYSFFNGLEPLSKFNTWSVDSLQLLYIYDRQHINPAIVDTAIIKVYKTGNGVSYWQFGSSAPFNVFAVVEYDRALRESKTNAGVVEFRRPLTVADSNGNASVWGEMSFALSSYNLSKGDEMAVTVSFKPGYTFTPGDTIFASSDFPTQPTKKANVFRVRTVDNNSNVEHLNGFYNNGLMVDKIQFATNRLTGGGFESTAKFLPSNFYSVSQFLDVRFRVSSPNVGIKNVDANGYGMGDVYPNPVSAKAAVVVPFAIGKAADVTLNVTNIIGQNVMTVSDKFNAGENKFTLTNLNNLKPGVYFCTISSGNFTSTRKVTITE